MKWLLHIFLFLIVTQLNSQTLSQNVIASEGAYFSNSSGSLAWTLGEISIETYSPSVILTQGFHQPEILSVPTVSVDQIGVYPNPTNGKININMRTPGHYNIYCVDVLGQILLKQDTHLQYNVIDISEFAPAPYFILVAADDKLIIDPVKFIKTE